MPHLAAGLAGCADALLAAVLLANVGQQLGLTGRDGSGHSVITAAPGQTLHNVAHLQTEQPRARIVTKSSQHSI